MPPSSCTRSAPPVEIVSLADIPAGTGLGSSGTFTVGLLRALYGWKREHVAAGDLAEEACRIEIDVLGRPVGKQDQYIAAFGGLTCFGFQPDGSVEVTPLDLSTPAMHELEERLLMFFTGSSRTADELLDDQRRRTEAGDDSMLASLERVEEIGLQIKDALKAGNVQRFGELMHEHWVEKRERSPGMSNPDIDRWYEAGLANGAVGGKLTGAGGGGFLLFLADDPAALRAAMTAEGLARSPLRLRPRRLDHRGSCLTAAPRPVVILAGGLGTRMRAVAEESPESAHPVRGEPFAYPPAPAARLRRACSEVVYVVGYEGAQIEAAVGDGSAFGLAVAYVDEGEHLHGTGGALRFALDAGALPEEFGVLYGDSYLPIDLDPVWAAFDAAGRPALMTVFRNEDRWDRSNAVFEAGRVVLYDKRPEARDERMAWIDYGLSVLRRDVVAEIPTGVSFDLAELFRELSARGDLAGYEVDTRFYEAGSPRGSPNSSSFCATESAGRAMGWRPPRWWRTAVLSRLCLAWRAGLRRPRRLGSRRSGAAPDRRSRTADGWSPPAGSGVIRPVAGSGRLRSHRPGGSSWAASGSSSVFLRVVGSSREGPLRGKALPRHRWVRDRGGFRSPCRRPPRGVETSCAGRRTTYSTSHGRPVSTASCCDVRFDGDEPRTIGRPAWALLVALPESCSSSPRSSLAPHPAAPEDSRRHVVWGIALVSHGDSRSLRRLLAGFQHSPVFIAGLLVAASRCCSTAAAAHACPVVRARLSVFSSVIALRSAARRGTVARALRARRGVWPRPVTIDPLRRARARRACARWIGIGPARGWTPIRSSRRQRRAGSWPVS